MERPIQLVDMPEDSMMHILERCDFVTIQRLRKTCHTFRNFIDDTKPKQSMNVLEVDGCPDRIHLKTYRNDDKELYPNGPKVDLLYEEFEKRHTKITWNRSDEKREKLIFNENGLELFYRDFGTILESKVSKWDMIVLMPHVDVLKRITEKFVSLNSPLKVHTLRFASPGPRKQVLAILPTICPDSLTDLIIDRVYRRWNMKKMVQMEQWKKAKALRMRTCYVSTDISHYAHFEKARVYFIRIKVKDLLKVKEIFLNTPSVTKTLELDGIHFPNPEYLKRIFGEYLYLVENEDQISKVWYFKRPDNYVVCMKFSETYYGYDIFIIPAGDVPQEALIH